MLRRVICLMIILVYASLPVFGLGGLSKKLVMEGKPTVTELYIADSGKPGPTIVILGGIHGDEEAGIKAAEEAVRSAPAKGRLVVMPRANKPACEAGVRTPYYMEDLNRSFPGIQSGNTTQEAAWAIMEIIKAYNPVLVLDLHESGERYGESEAALGQSLVVSEKAESAAIVLDIIDKVNTAMETEASFTFAGGAPKGSVNREVSEILAIPVITVETYKGQEMGLRIKQQLTVINAIMKYYGLL